MPRPTWNGAISFGLVTIPIKLYTAVSRKSVRFNQIDTRTGARVRQKRVSEATGEEVTMGDMAKGYELPSGEYVLVSEDELAALDPKATRTIDIQEFVDLADIDPIFYDATYYIAPDKATVKPYALLARAMEEAGKVGIATFVMRSKQYLGAIRPVDGRLVLSTMIYADEINDPTDIPELDDVEDTDVSSKELAMAEQLVASLSDDFQPSRHHDTYREKVLDLIERKAEGAEALTEAPEAADEEKVIDLMAALEASVAAAKETRKRHPSARAEPAGDDADVDDSDAGAAKPAKKRAAKKAPAKKSTAKKAPAKKTARARKSA